MNKIFNIFGWIMLFGTILSLPIALIYAIAHSILILGPIFFFISLMIFLINITSVKPSLIKYFIPISMMVISFYICGIIEIIKYSSVNQTKYKDLISYSIPLLIQIILLFIHFNYTFLNLNDKVNK